MGDQALVVLAELRRGETHAETQRVHAGEGDAVLGVVVLDGLERTELGHLQKVPGWFAPSFKPAGAGARQPPMPQEQFVSNDAVPLAR
jgi:hypothetical protein